MTDTTAAPEQIVRLPLDRLHESPFNHRKHFDETSLQELAQDIKAHGRVLQPIVVRPRVPPLFTGDPDAVAGHELVFGHRRFRAAAIAGLDAVDCIVRDMTDEHVKLAQISENLQRKDVHAIEEAEGFQALIDEHNQTADLIAEQFGKSRSYVYGRLKLLALCPEVRNACLAGEIGSEVGLLIARVGGNKLQQKALQDIKGRNGDPKDGGKQSFRRIRDLLVERYTLALKNALFDVEDEMLVPAAGHCVRCVKRSGNAPEFEDVLNETKAHQWSRTNCGPDVCTDPDCFDTKKKAHLKREADKLREAGKVVVDGAKARQAIDAYGKLKPAFVPLKSVRAELKKAADGKKPEVVVIQDQRTGETIEAVKVADLEAAGLRKAEPQKPVRGGYDPVADELERAEREAEAEQESARRQALFTRALDVVRGRERTEFDMRLIARFVLDSLPYDDEAQLLLAFGADDRQDLAARIDAMTPFEVGTLMLATAMAINLDLSPYSRAPAEYLDAVVSEYSITLEPPTDDASPPASAARAPEDVAPDAADDNAGDLISLPAAIEPRKARKGKAKAAASAALDQKEEAGSAGVQLSPAAAWPFPRTFPAEVE